MSVADRVMLTLTMLVLIVMLMQVIMLICQRFESQTWRVTGKSIPNLWRDKHPAIKGLRPPEHHTGHTIRTRKTPPSPHNQINNDDNDDNSNHCPPKGDPKRRIRPTDHLNKSL